MYQFDLFLFMKKSTVMLGAIFGTLLMGCSDEEIANVETSSRNAIGFNVLSNAAETRATPTTPDNLKNTDFDVFAFTGDGTAFMGKVDTEFGHDGVNIVYNNGKWDYKNASDLRYWPTGALDFYAFNPGTVSEDMMMNYMWEASGTVQKISYTCIDEYGANTGHANYDVMYAIAKGQEKDMNNGIVKFNFKHILSQVVFKAKTEYDNMQVNIKEIKIHNIKFSGVFTLPATAEEMGSWSVNDVNAPKFGVVQNANIEVNGNATATDISTDTPMLNIPQTLTAWTVSAPNKSKLEADNAKQCYLEIACKIQQSGAYLLGSADNYGTIYVPFGATWEPGKRYIYTLIFGGGYNDQGEAVLNPIRFDAETTGWVDDKDVNVQP
ncbi:hypothetical protein HMPREF9009_04934 [Bacteroides sp. 3_1_13]|nr:hypothetical protein HMPREF9009_04934 [Bacteroides sp. 3_1_13]